MGSAPCPVSVVASPWPRDAPLGLPAVRATLGPWRADAQYLGARPGIIAAWPPWRQPWRWPPHGHSLVPGGGCTSVGPWGAVRHGFVWPARVGMAVWRGKRLAAMRQACALRGGPSKNARLVTCDGDRVTCTARAWSSQGPRQRGPKRQALQGETCCLVLLAWGVRWWHGTPLALALDATALGTRLGVLAGSGVDRGWALPGAWGLPAHTKHAWRRLGRRRPAMPRGWPVMGWTARGW
jgi:hypothetical protein